MKSRAQTATLLLLHYAATGQPFDDVEDTFS